MAHVVEEYELRNAVKQGEAAANTARDTGAGYGATGAAIGSTLTPFLTSELMHPQGFSQQDQSAQVAAGLAGAGGANSGLVGEAAQRAGVSRNAGGFQAALGEAARERQKAAAGASEGIAAQNANLRESQRQQAAKGLQGLYGTDVGAQMESQGQVAGDINAQANANRTGWVQNMNDTISPQLPEHTRGYKGK